MNMITSETKNVTSRLLSTMEEIMLEVVSSGGAPTPAGTSVFTKHNWIWEWGICGLMGGAFIT